MPVHTIAKMVNENEFPEAQITFDKFHVIKVLNDAVDKVRRLELKHCSELKKTRYIWLKNPNKLTVEQQSALETL